MTAILAHPGVAALLAAADQVSFAIDTRDGPLVTPELFTCSDDRLWMLAGRSTAKGRLLEDGAAVGVAATTTDGMVTVAGRAQVFDPLEPSGLVQKVADLADATSALVRFLRDNGYEMAGAAGQAVTGRLGAPPDPRVLICCTATAVAAAAHDGRVVTATGWSRRDADPADLSDGGPPGSINRPSGLSSTDVAIGWEAAEGPIALPARWCPERGVAIVPRPLFEAVGARQRCRASMCADQWKGPGPLGKEGVVFRGRGWAEMNGDDAELTLDVARIVRWDGVEVRGQNV